MPFSFVDQSRPQVNRWFGREQEVEQLTDWLHRSNIRLVGVVAAGGYGKSALTNYVCQQLAPKHPFVWTTFSEAYAFEGWAGWLMIQLSGRLPVALKVQHLIGAIRQVWQQWSGWLVLDNLETLVDENGQWLDARYGELIGQLIQADSHGKILITSRERPQLPTNIAAVSRWKYLKGLDSSAGICLLQTASIQGKEPELATFVDLCGGHPLLLDLSVGLLKTDFGDEPHIKHITSGQYDLFKVIGLHRGDPQTSIENLLDFSINRLSSQIRDLLLALWVYPMRFNIVRLQDAYPQLEVTVEKCRQLAQRSLLQEICENGVWEFWFQPLIRSYLQQRVLAHFRDNKNRGGEANTLQAIGDVLQFLKHCDEALSRYNEALALYEQVGANLGKANTLKAMGHHLMQAKKTALAAQTFEQALDLYRNSQSRLGTGNTLQALAAVYQQQGKIKESFALSMEAQKVLQSIDEMPLENMPYPNWLKRLIRFSQRGKLYFWFCVVVGVLAFPIALIAIIAITLWRLAIGRFRR